MKSVNINIDQLKEHPHRRYNYLTDEWVLVSPHRAKRPWQGKVEKKAEISKPEYVDDCYLCPGNERAGGQNNPKYADQFVFVNDFSALKPASPEFELDSSLLKAESVKGICKVICFSPKHNLTLPEMDLKDIANVVRVWKDEYELLAEEKYINHIQIFENKGEIMGCSNPHPHGQIWAESSIPVEMTKELSSMKSYSDSTNSCLLCDYLELEKKTSERVIIENQDFAVIVPFWAVWPFETMIISKKHVQSLSDFNEDTITNFADVIKKITIRYDNIFKTSFPYSAGLHQQPVDGKSYNEFHFHMHFYPPLLRSATVKKFMVGYEMLANPQRDITPEASAKMLKELSDIHYLEAEL